MMKDTTGILYGTVEIKLDRQSRHNKLCRLIAKGENVIFTILGYVFVALILFVLGCIRGEQMERERAEKLVNSNKPFYTLKNGVSVYLQSDMPDDV